MDVVGYGGSTISRKLAIVGVDVMDMHDMSLQALVCFSGVRYLFFKMFF